VAFGAASGCIDGQLGNQRRLSHSGPTRDPSDARCALGSAVASLQPVLGGQKLTLAAHEVPGRDSGLGKKVTRQEAIDEVTRALGPCIVEPEEVSKGRDVEVFGMGIVAAEGRVVEAVAVRPEVDERRRAATPLHHGAVPVRDADRPERSERPQGQRGLLPHEAGAADVGRKHIGALHSLGHRSAQPHGSTIVDRYDDDVACHFGDGPHQVLEPLAVDLEKLPGPRARQATPVGDFVSQHQEGVSARLPRREVNISPAIGHCGRPSEQYHAPAARSSALSTW